MHRRVVGLFGGQRGEHLPGRFEAIALQCFERRAALNKGAVRRQQRLETRFSTRRRNPFHRAGEAVALAVLNHDGARRAGDGDGVADARDRLRQCIVGDRGLLPGRLDQLGLAYYFVGTRHEDLQQLQLPPRHPHRTAIASQLWCGRVEVKWTEDERAARWHARILRSFWTEFTP